MRRAQIVPRAIRHFRVTTDSRNAKEVLPNLARVGLWTNLAPFRERTAYGSECLCRYNWHRPPSALADVSTHQPCWRRSARAVTRRPPSSTALTNSGADRLVSVRVIELQSAVVVFSPYEPGVVAGLAHQHLKAGWTAAGSEDTLLTGCGSGSP
jgi:hypothetical protein